MKRNIGSDIRVERADPGEDIVQINQRRSYINRNRRRSWRGSLRCSFPADVPGSTSVRMRSFNSGVGHIEPEGHRIPVDLREYVESWVVPTEREVPAVKLPEFGARLNGPDVFSVFCSCIHDKSQHSANAIIGASREAQHIRQRSVTPGSVKLSRPQAR